MPDWDDIAKKAGSFLKHAAVEINHSAEMTARSQSRNKNRSSEEREYYDALADSFHDTRDKLLDQWGDEFEDL